MRLKVAFDDPNNGWIGLTIDYGNKSLVIVASYTPSDSLLDLTNALGGLLEYDGEANVTWHEEPNECDMRFSRTGQIIRLEIIRHADHRRSVFAGETVLDVSGKYEQICIPFWRPLRALEGRAGAEALERGWHRPFPSRELNILTELVRNRRSD